MGSGNNFFGLLGIFPTFFSFLFVSTFRFIIPQSVRAWSNNLTELTKSLITTSSSCGVLQCTYDDLSAKSSDYSSREVESKLEAEQLPILNIILYLLRCTTS